MRKTPGHIWLILGFSFAFYLLVTKGVFNSYPFSMDEYAYTYQAEIFAEGKLGLERGETPTALVENQMIYTDEMIMAKYPPAWSAVLAIGAILGNYDWINPFLSIVVLFLLYRISAQFVGGHIASLTLVLIAFNPYFFGYAASYFSQTLSLLLTTLVVYLVVFRETYKKRQFWFYLVFSFLFLFFTRPSDAIILAVALNISLLFEDKKSNRSLGIILTISGVILGVIFITVAWHSPLQSSIHSFLKHTAKLDFENQNIIVALLKKYVDNATHFLFPLLFNHFVWYGGLFLFLFALLGAIHSPAPRHLRALVLAVIVVNILAYNVHPYWGWPQYGSRYYYQTYGCMSLLAAFGIKKITSLPSMNEISKRTFGFNSINIILLMVFIWQIIGTGNKLVSYKGRFNFVNQLQNHITTSCPSKSIVVLNGPFEKPENWPAFVNWRDLKRNKWLRGPLFIVLTESEYIQVQNHFSSHERCDVNLSEIKPNIIK